MSFLNAAPETMAAAASDLNGLASTIRAANAAAAASTTGIAAAGTDEVSAQIAALFGAHAQTYQAAGARAAAFHDQFAQTLNGGATSYATTEASSAWTMSGAIQQIQQDVRAAEMTAGRDAGIIEANTAIDVSKIDAWIADWRSRGT